MIYVIGWLTVKPGKRGELMDLLAPAIAKNRREDGCLFYEVHPSATDGDVLVFVEGWANTEAHQAHQRAPHHTTAVDHVVRLSVRGRFEEIEAAKVNSVTPEFAA